MEKQPTRAMQVYAAIIAIFGWTAVILQFYLILLNRTTSVAETIVRFFSFFTILTNILAAACCTWLWLKPGSSRGQYFSRPGTLTAITVYITIVGLVYNLVLRSYWEPRGLQQIVDELLHSVMPSLFLIFWIVLVPKGKLQWKEVFPWLIYPLVYIVFIIVRGALSGFYPYPFIDVNKIAYHEALINTAGLLIGFLVLSLLLVGIGKLSRTTGR
jgi:hypothetical protein